MNVQPPQFRATVQLREHLAGVEQALRIESAFQTLLLIQVDLVEHRRHEVAFFNADAMLAGKHAPDLDRKSTRLNSSHT